MMWTRTFSQVYPGLKKEDIWPLWTDINQWPSWHGDLDYCKLEGAFEVGNHFMLKPKGAPAVKIVLTSIDEGQSFTDCTNFWGAKMYDTHAMIETPEGLLISNTLVVSGPLQWLWIKLVAQNVANTVPQELEALVKLARSKHG
ncbi:MAG: polyketide cyclase [Gammaproteobacteria bacterium]|nr:polyketide cyclase [Gammaproteobacteria bacterium]MBP9729708.1 polyketide cyclase [Gammaproteobacteria bacterium]